MGSIMRKMGFAFGWVEQILKCVTLISYLVSINGKKGDFFLTTRDLRQGDPLSPFLFLICSEGLSSLMRLLIRKGKIAKAKASRNGPLISHLLFVDDCILFGKATVDGARALKSILLEYENCSGQCVNFEKSSIFFSKNTEESICLLISRELRVRHSTNPKKYLGLPNLVGRSKKLSFQTLKDRIKVRIDGWATKCLSQGGKEVFIKVVLWAIPTYAMAYFLLPKSLCVEMDSLISRFWWQKSLGKQVIHWCSWNKLCES